MTHVANKESKPNELSIEQIDLSISDVTDALSLDDRLRAFNLAPVHLLGACTDKRDEGDYTVRDEMRFALQESQEAVFTQSEYVDAEDKSTVSSLTYEDFYTSFDELQKRYTRKDIRPNPHPSNQSAAGVANPTDVQITRDHEVSL